VLLPEQVKQIPAPAAIAGAGEIAVTMGLARFPNDSLGVPGHICSAAPIFGNHPEPSSGEVTGKDIAASHPAAERGAMLAARLPGMLAPIEPAETQKSFGHPANILHNGNYLLTIMAVKYAFFEFAYFVMDNVSCFLEPRL
jgi:hypothetical protein